jgi:hypothetical protein
MELTDGVKAAAIDKFDELSDWAQHISQNTDWQVVKRSDIPEITAAALTAYESEVVKENARLRGELEMVKEKMRGVANLAHHGALLGYREAAEALTPIRALTVDYWDMAECDRLRSTPPEGAQ